MPSGLGQGATVLKIQTHVLINCLLGANGVGRLLWHLIPARLSSGDLPEAVPKQRHMFETRVSGLLRGAVSYPSSGLRGPEASPQPTQHSVVILAQ